MATKTTNKITEQEAILEEYSEELVENFENLIELRKDGKFNDENRVFESQMLDLLESSADDLEASGRVAKFIKKTVPKAKSSLVSVHGVKKYKETKKTELVNNQ
jgi:hypothetical protein